MASTKAATSEEDPGASTAEDLDVRLVGVSKHYGEVAAVKSLDLEVKRGEFFTLLGPSGSGKTTTLRMIAGFEEPDTGRVELDGEQRCSCGGKGRRHGLPGKGKVMVDDLKQPHAHHANHEQHQWQLLVAIHSLLSLSACEPFLAG